MAMIYTELFADKIDEKYIHELSKDMFEMKNILTEQDKLLDKMTYERWIVLNQYKIIKEKIYWRREYLRMDREFFEELKCSEVAKEIGLIVVRELYELYFSEKKSKE